jgi:hypothetical protein
MLMLILQGQHSPARMRVWRACKALAAVVLRDGVYLLPNRDEFAEALQAQREEVIASGGSGQVLEVEARKKRKERGKSSFLHRCRLARPLTRTRGCALPD